MNTITSAPNVPGTQRPSDLQRDVAARIIEHVQTTGMTPGMPLRDSVLARQFEVSRTPVRRALDLLVEMGAVRHVPRRGYVLNVEASALPDIARVPTANKASKVYNQIVAAYFAGEIVDRVSESELMRRFDVERPLLVGALSRLATEGITAASAGYGWQFAPLVETRKTLREAYFRFRLLLEPAALLEPCFEADKAMLLEARAQQEDLLGSIDTGFDIARLYEENERLHSMLIRFSNNVFIIKVLSFDAPAPRLPEYKHYQNRARIKSACREHIEIIDAVLEGAMPRASDLMRAHIVNARDVDA